MVLVCFAGPQRRAALMEQAWIAAHAVPKMHCPTPRKPANRNPHCCLLAPLAVMVITESVCLSFSIFPLFWRVINYITLSLIDLCTLCLDRVTFIAVGPSNIIMAIHHV